MSYLAYTVQCCSIDSIHYTFCLSLSDAAKCKVPADVILKSLHPKLFHVMCVAHLLHNCTMQVKSHFEDIDQLIARVKSAA